MKKLSKVILSLVLVMGVISLSLNTKKEQKELKVNNKGLAVFIKQSDGSYKTATSIPQSGYTLNTDKSTCNKGAIPTWSNNTLNLANLSEENTNCYLFFDKLEGITIPDIIATNNPKDTTPDFSQAATEDEGVYRVLDGMYGGTSYYWRGAVTNNYVKFANYCWRIVRINGDKTMRLIYDGSSCHANGESTTDSIAVASTAYNTSRDRSEYVGWTYIEGSQRPTNLNTATASNAKSQTESWYTSNITGTNATKVADGKFCNDRNVASGYTWESQPSSAFYYVGYERLVTNKAPTLNCPSGDIYTLKVGLITADEVAYAGGVYGISNSSYYLYNGQYYWTMSPSGTYSTPDTGVFYVRSGSYLYNFVTGITPGVRPVINLKSDTKFVSGGNGTLDNPYVVEGSE